MGLSTWHHPVGLGCDKGKQCCFGFQKTKHGRDKVNLCPLVECTLSTFSDFSLLTLCQGLAMKTLFESQTIREHMFLFFAVMQDYSSRFPWLTSSLFSQRYTPDVSYLERGFLDAASKNLLHYCASCQQHQ